MTIKPAIDCTGSDHDVGVTIPAVIHLLAIHGDIETLLVGQPDTITAQLKRLHATANPHIHVVPASGVVSVDDPVEVVLYKKKDSPMRVAINQLKEDAAQACISADNTDALITMSRYVLKTLDGIDRLTIVTTIPNERGAGTTILDLGANADYEPEHLLQFVRMASAMASVVGQKPHPTVGLPSIGEEAIKGNGVVKQTGELLCASDLNFSDSAEGSDIFKDATDIVICDGFIGNVTLRSTEGLVKVIGEMLHQKFSRS